VSSSLISAAAVWVSAVAVVNRGRLGLWMSGEVELSAGRECTYDGHGGCR